MHAPHPSRADRALMVVAASVVLLCAALVLTFGIGRDQGIYGVVAREMLDGGMPYRDAWDFKPPGIFLLYGLARGLTGGASWGIRLLEAAGLIATAIGLVVLSRRWWGEPRIGVVAAALMALVHAQLDFWHTAQPETFGGMLIVGGLVAGATGTPRAWRYIAAGLLFGTAGLLKPPLAGAGAVLAIWDAVGRWRRADGVLVERLKSASVPLGGVLIGGVIPFVLTLAWFAGNDALGDLYRTLFVFTPHYTRLGWARQGLGSLLYRALAEWLVGYSSAIAMGILLAVAQWRSVVGRRAVGLLIGVVVIQLVGVALQAKFFPYHYAGTWPVASMVAALGWWGLWRAAVARGRRAVASVVSLWLLAIAAHTATTDVHGHFWLRSIRRARVFLVDRDDQATIDGLATVADVNASANRRMANAIREHTGSDDPLYVWGFEPVLYDLAERPAASRYIYNVPQRVPWSAEWARRELMEDLAASAPVAIVVVSHDVMFQVTGDAHSSASLLDDPDGFPELRGLLLTGYRRVEQIEDLELYVRR